MTDSPAARRAANKVFSASGAGSAGDASTTQLVRTERGRPKADRSE